MEPIIEYTTIISHYCEATIYLYIFITLYIYIDKLKKKHYIYIYITPLIYDK
jgi:hypothetical protein